MALVESVTEWLCRVDDAMPDVPHHRQAALAPSERVTRCCHCRRRGVTEHWLPL